MATSDFIIKLKSGKWLKTIENNGVVIVVDDVNDAGHFSLWEIKKNKYIMKLLKRKQASFYGRKEQIQ